MISFHLIEIKWRFFYFLVSYSITIFIIWSYKEIILFNLTPLNLIFTSLTEAFYLYIYFTILISFIFNIPYLYLQIYSFIIPGLYRFEVKRYLNLLFIFWIATIVFSKNILSSLINFFTLFESQFLNIALTFNHFISFLNQLIFAILVIFTIPILISFFKEKLINRRKIYYFILIIIIALITPPDVISLIITFFPLFLFSEIVFYIYRLKSLL